MKIKKVNLRNFRRLEDAEIELEDEETIFVGPNNSGKTSATSAFKLFLKTREFRIHDFSVSKISEIDAFGISENAELPAIEMDLWLSIDLDSEGGRVFKLLPTISMDVQEVGLRIKFAVQDQERLKEHYDSAFPPKDDGSSRDRTLSYYLSLENNISRHFDLVYSLLEESGGELEEKYIKADEAKRTLLSLIKVDFVNAQRNIDDHEVSRSTRLSQAFAQYYKHNLRQAEVSDEANRVIEENNNNLNSHYEESFGDMMKILGNLGFPSANDRQLKVVSSLNPEVALRGNTDLWYSDPNHDHQLPESYNGLGFKNLVYIALQVSHFYLQWIKTEERRPLCQVIFIEEPEVHLHSQVQQTFITNIWKIIGDFASRNFEEANIPQLVVTTHSSHILEAIDFEKVRYFKRCCLKNEEESIAKTLNASKVLSMRSFQPNRASASGKVEDKAKVLKFLKKYLKLTHCDLFFSDAAILVEGAAEKLLLPAMIDEVTPKLKEKYLTILEVGGAYASKFAGLLEFIGIPYLVITDIDSVDPSDKRRSCRADDDNAITSNPSIKFYLNELTISSLKQLTSNDLQIADKKGYITFQRPTQTNIFGNTETMFGRTFEESFIYQNMDKFKNGNLKCGFEIPEDAEAVRKHVYGRVKSSSFKKTDFALSMGLLSEEWQTPEYISSGLHWLNRKLTPDFDNTVI